MHSLIVDSTSGYFQLGVQSSTYSRLDGVHEKDTWYIYGWLYGDLGEFIVTSSMVSSG